MHQNAALCDNGLTHIDALYRVVVKVDVAIRWKLWMSQQSPGSSVSAT